MAMELVRTKEEILENIATLDSYLKDPALKDYAANLIRRGTFYVVVQRNNELGFYPSRFIGYKNNSRAAHMENRGKDVLDTNKRISEIVGFQPEKSAQMEEELKKFCIGLGITPTKTGIFGVSRKYWRI